MDGAGAELGLASPAAVILGSIYHHHHYYRHYGYPYYGYGYYRPYYGYYRPYWRHHYYTTATAPIATITITTAMFTVGAVGGGSGAASDARQEYPMTRSKTKAKSSWRKLARRPLSGRSQHVLSRRLVGWLIGMM